MTGRAAEMMKRKKIRKAAAAAAAQAVAEAENAIAEAVEAALEAEKAEVEAEKAEAEAEACQIFFKAALSTFECKTVCISSDEKQVEVASHGEASGNYEMGKDMGIEAPIPISTEDGKSRKKYHKFINRSLMFASVGAAVVAVGLAAYRVYAARTNSSGSP